MDYTPVHLLSTEQRLTEIAKILLIGCQRLQATKAEKRPGSTGLQGEEERHYEDKPTKEVQ